MCGRFIIDEDLSKIFKRYMIKEYTAEYLPGNDIYPSQVVPAVTHNREKELKFFKWGFIFPGYNGLVINGRSETIETKPLFKKAFFSKRCIIPATGFYEWKKEGDKKIKYKIRFKDNSLFSMAGIYNEFIDRKGISFTGFTIITTQPNRLLSQIHNRMPVIINRDMEDTWLDNSIKDVNLLKSILMPYGDKYGELELLR